MIKKLLRSRKVDGRKLQLIEIARRAKVTTGTVKKVAEGTLIEQSKPANSIDMEALGALLDTQEGRDMTHVQIAEKLGVSGSSVGRAIRRLRGLD